MVLHYEDKDLYSISDLDLDEWFDWACDYKPTGAGLASISSEEAESVTYTGFETHNGISYYRIDSAADSNGSPHITLYAPSANGDIYEFLYMYIGGSTGLPREHEKDFFDMLDTVCLQQGSSDGSVTPSTPVPQTSSVVPQSDTIAISVNGTQVYPDADPFIMNDRTMVPIRVVAEALGYKVSWDAPNQCVTMSRGNFDVQVMVDSTWITKYIDGQVVEYGFMDVAPCIRDSRTFIPLRAVAEAMGCDVYWDGNTRSIQITEGGVG